MAKSHSAQEKKFEEAMAELEDIVSQLESSKLPLEKSLQLFEQGIALSKICTVKLVEAEKSVDELLKNLQTPSDTPA